MQREHQLWTKDLRTLRTLIKEKGLVCDMNAIRRDEELDNLHSIYVDQWDWEKVIGEKDRTSAYRN